MHNSKDLTISVPQSCFNLSILWASIVFWRTSVMQVLRTLWQKMEPQHPLLHPQTTYREFWLCSTGFPDPLISEQEQEWNS